MDVHMMMEEKKECRKKIRLLKENYSLAEKMAKSETIWQKVEIGKHFEDARIVLAYWSMSDEVHTHDFIRKWALEKTILLPKVRGNELDIYYYEGEASLKPGEAYGILEPAGRLFTDLEKIDLVLVPGVAFDGNGNRLGRGKGYYDKILRNSPAWKAGVCFDFQFLEQVPTEDHDEKMDEVVWG